MLTRNPEDGHIGAMEKKSAPTGCYKCGRAGHWSKDCPEAPNPYKTHTPSSSSAAAKPWAKPASLQRPAEGPKPKKLPRQRPKLTPDLLLSKDGLGYVLKYIPHMVQMKGRGHEVSDLGRLIEAYIQWHSRLLPYYSFQQFVEKVEKVGSSKRVRDCLRELRERVAKGEDPSTLHDPCVEATTADDNMAGDGVGLPNGLEEDTNGDGEDEIQEDMFDELFRQAMGEDTSVHNDGPSHSFQQAAVLTTPDESGTQRSEEDISESRSKIQMSEDQKARMEANRLKALERAAARASQAHAV